MTSDEGAVSLDPLLAAAQTRGAAEDYRALFAALAGRELFFMVTGPGDSAMVALTPMGGGARAVRFFTSRHDPRIVPPFAGILWEKGLKMVADIPEADGLIVENQAANWIAIDRRAVEALLAA